MVMVGSRDMGEVMEMVILLLKSIGLDFQVGLGGEREKLEGKGAHYWKFIW